MLSLEKGSGFKAQFVFPSHIYSNKIFFYTKQWEIPFSLWDLLLLTSIWHLTLAIILLQKDARKSSESSGALFIWQLKDSSKALLGLSLRVWKL